MKNQEFRSFFNDNFKASIDLTIFIQDYITETYNDFIGVREFQRLDKDQQIVKLVDYTENEPEKRKYIIDSICKYKKIDKDKPAQKYKDLIVEFLCRDSKLEFIDKKQERKYEQDKKGEQDEKEKQDINEYKLGILLFIEDNIEYYLTINRFNHKINTNLFSIVSKTKNIRTIKNYIDDNELDKYTKKYFSFSNSNCIYEGKRIKIYYKKANNKFTNRELYVKTTEVIKINKKYSFSVNVEDTDKDIFLGSPVFDIMNKTILGIIYKIKNNQAHIIDIKYLKDNITKEYNNPCKKNKIRLPQNLFRMNRFLDDLFSIIFNIKRLNEQKYIDAIQSLFLSTKVINNNINNNEKIITNKQYNDFLTIDLEFNEYLEIEILKYIRAIYVGKKSKDIYDYIDILDSFKYLIDKLPSLLNFIDIIKLIKKQNNAGTIRAYNFYIISEIFLKEHNNKPSLVKYSEIPVLAKSILQELISHEKLQTLYKKIYTLTNHKNKSLITIFTNNNINYLIKQTESNLIDIYNEGLELLGKNINFKENNIGEIKESIISYLRYNFCYVKTLKENEKITDKNKQKYLQTIYNINNYATT